VTRPSNIQHIRRHSSSLLPLETGEAPLLERVDNIRSVVFDVYGTLFISGSGDISLAQKEDRSPALVASLKTAGYEIPQEDANWTGLFHETLQAFSESRRREGIEFPEVRIEEVWAGFADAAGRKGWLAGGGDLALAIIDHECRVNPCWPMPGLLDILHWLSSRGYQLGIVSNAQFYTPLLFPALLGHELLDFAFDEDLCIWSYVEREGKPSTHLYRKLAGRLSLKGLQPEQTLYVGNDLRNDIWPAGELGYRTALFAGDQRSLRWRRDDPDCAGVRPDFILTDLRQIREIVG